MEETGKQTERTVALDLVIDGESFKLYSKIIGVPEDVPKGDISIAKAAHHQFFMMLNNPQPSMRFLELVDKDNNIVLYSIEDIIQVTIKNVLEV